MSNDKIALKICINKAFDLSLPQTMNKLIFLILFIIFIPFHLYGHSEVESESPESAEIYALLLESALSLKIGRSSEQIGPEAKIRLQNGVQRLLFQKSYVDLDQNGFWLMADALSKLYLQELKEACEDCKLPNKEEVLVQVQDLIAQGWTSKFSIGMGNILVERYGFEFANLAYRYGLIAGIVKVMGELVEDALLVVFKMPNAHFLCEVITYYITIYSKSFNTFLRGFKMPNYYNSSRIRALSRVFATSYIVRRALKKIEIEIPAFQIKNQELASFLSENEETRVTDRLLDYAEHKLEEVGWSKGAERLEGALARRHRFNRFIQKLDRQIQKQRRSLVKRSLTPEEKRQAESEVRALVKIRKKIFEGKRYKRFLFLKKRRKADSLGEFAQSAKILQGSEFWFFSLKNDLLMPNLHFDPSFVRSNFRKKTLEVNLEPALNVWQRNQLQMPPEEAQVIGRSLETVNLILDPKQPRKMRYLHFMFLDSFLTKVMPGIALKLINHKIEELDFNKATFKEASKIWGLKFKVFKRLSQFAGRLDSFSDLIRYGAVNKKDVDVTLPYHARDYYLELMKVFRFLSAFSNVETVEDIQKFILGFDEKIRDLDSKRYWVEKKKREISFRALRGVYSCGALY